MKKKKIAPFFLIVADRDKRVFTVEGPMVDAEWNEAVGRAQKEGRRVTCCGAGADRSRAEKDYAAASRFRLARSGSIVDAPPCPNGGFPMPNANCHF
ncbi:MAG TPA: hypothetical protein VIF88_12190 [Methylocystis sp.]|jgi:hypothetical protein